jgi:hypothetical protein
MVSHHLTAKMPFVAILLGAVSAQVAGTALAHGVLTGAPVPCTHRSRAAIIGHVYLDGGPAHHASPSADPGVSVVVMNDQTGTVVARAVSGSGGRFDVKVLPGSYDVTANLVRSRCSTVDVHVRIHQHVNAILRCGIP